VTVLSTFGIEEDAERLYRNVLRQDRMSVRWHAEVLGWTDARLRGAMLPLVRLRLVRQDLEGNLVAPHPRAALTRLVDRETARLELRQRELEDVAAAVGDFSADHLAGRIDTLAAGALDPVPDDLQTATAVELLRATSGPLRVFHVVPGAGPGADPEVERRLRRELQSGRELRAVYQTSALDVPEQLAWLRRRAGLGERQRVVEHLPAEVALFGDEAVLAAPRWGTLGGTAVLSRMPLLVAVFTALFDDTWAGGHPVPDDSMEQDVETRLLTLLGTGYKDEAIARYLGIGVRTVRRRIAGLMEELGVHTRFQLGAVAERRGLLRRRP
jgi:DNA-binding CsgD family transcriptional regulator